MILQFSKWPHISNIHFFFEPFFGKNNCNVVGKSFLAIFFSIVIFVPNWWFCKGYSLCMEAIFVNFQNGLIFRILIVFRGVFPLKQLQWCWRVVCGTFYAFLNFDPNSWLFFKGYSLCMVAFFLNFQYSHIFRILIVFLSRLLHRTTAMGLKNRFQHLLRNLNFDLNWWFCKGYIAFARWAYKLIYFRLFSREMFSISWFLLVPSLQRGDNGWR